MAVSLPQPIQASLDELLGARYTVDAPALSDQAVAPKAAAIGLSELIARVLGEVDKLEVR